MRLLVNSHTTLREMVEHENVVEGLVDAAAVEHEASFDFCNWCCIPIRWFNMLCKETHWSLVFGVVIVNGMSQGLCGALSQVATEYYMKDVQKVQPSQAQFYSGITSIPWMIKPIWGILTDVIPILGYRRRPYLIFAGTVGVIAMLLLSLHGKLHIVLAVLLLTVGTTGTAIADVTMDACVAQNSITRPSLAADMQSLCALTESMGALLGFSISGVTVHLIGPMGVYAWLSIPSGLVFLVGILLDEPYTPNFSYRQVNQKVIDACKAMWTTLKCQDIWRPCLYMYLSIAVTVNIFEGLFFWVTEAKGGPSFSQENIGFLFSVGSVGSLIGVILYQNILKDHPFRDLLFWAQLLHGLSGMLDLILVLRWNLRLGLPDYLFAVTDEGVSQMIGRLKWMPLLVISSKLCPSGIEGTFFALIMSIQNVGVLSASWGGGFLLHILKVTRTRFEKLWLAILIRNILRITPLALLFLIPRGDSNSSLLPTEFLSTKDWIEGAEHESVELVSLVNSTDAE